MRWEDLNLTEEQLRGRIIIECVDEESCYVCNNQTKYIDYCYESRMCSEECQNKMNEEYEAWLKEVTKFPLE